MQVLYEQEYPGLCAVGSKFWSFDGNKIMCHKHEFEDEPTKEELDQAKRIAKHFKKTQDTKYGSFWVSNVCKATCYIGDFEGSFYTSEGISDSLTGGDYFNPDFDESKFTEGFSL